MRPFLRLASASLSACFLAFAVEVAVDLCFDMTRPSSGFNHITFRPEAKWQLIYVRIGADVFESLQSLFFVDHQIDALFAMAALDSALSLEKQRLIRLPIFFSSRSSQGLQSGLSTGTEPLQQLVIQG